MDLTDLRDIDLSLLGDAIDDWATVVGNLEDLKKAAERGLHGAANKADWAGVNAMVSKEFIGKTAGEFADAHGQARSIYLILKDTRDELVRYQTQLTDAMERGRQKNLTVIGYEGGFSVTSNVPPEGRAAQDEDNKADITALRDELQDIVERATESDTSASTVLKAIADQSRLGFSDARYKDRDSAAEAIEQADQLAELATKNPEELTPKDLDRLTAGLRKYAGDGLFAERFASHLGAEGTLSFWAGINDPQVAYALGHKRGNTHDELQKHLGLTLATASQSDSATMADWRNKMVDMVDRPVSPGKGFPLGAQVMSNLMRWGDYDDRFLVDYGDKLIATEKKYTGNGEHGAWGRVGSDPLLNRTGSDSGWDPMTGYLKALSKARMPRRRSSTGSSSTRTTRTIPSSVTPTATAGTGRFRSPTSSTSSKNAPGRMTSRARVRRASRAVTRWHWRWRPLRPGIRRERFLRRTHRRTPGSKPVWWRVWWHRSRMNRSG
ncbi:hypothetical protein [Streptomyces sp. NPDC006997]|uniref:hypothetical protein n=1 Tax=Streptomyces sp. NPDC006997 TaxID=3155356 RepID=UPI0033D7C929